jgi:nucleoside-diphosphate-sugar epimerase
MNKLFITGASGQIGRDLTRYLSEYLVEDINQCSTVVHCAGNSGSDVLKLVNSNVNYLKETLELCVNNGVKQFIFFSTASIYGVNSHDKTLSQSERFSVNPYVCSKLLAEDIVEHYQEKIDCLILRLPGVLTSQTGKSFFDRLIAPLDDTNVLKISNGKLPFNWFTSSSEIARFITFYSFDKKFEKMNFCVDPDNKLTDFVGLIADKTNKKIEDIPHQAHAILNNSMLKTTGFEMRKPMVIFNQWLNGDL